MTEAEWMASGSPDPMLAFLHHTVSIRKLRLFGVACCRRIWELFPDVTCELAVDIAQSHADGHFEDDVLEAACQRVSSKVGRRSVRDQHAEYAAVAAQCVSSWNDLGRTAEAAAVTYGVFAARDGGWDNTWEMGKRAENRQQASLLRDIFGNPFRPVAIDPAWLTSTVVALACGIYEEKAFDRMPYLADALQDAGCENADILDHCRGPGPHVRGCWVVDLVLGKE